MQVQRQYVQLLADKTNEADLSSSVFAILMSATRTIKIQNLLRSTNFIKTENQRRNKGSTGLYCLYSS